MIRMTKLFAPGLESPLDMILPAGRSALIVTRRELESSLLLKLILGFQSPGSGDLVVLDTIPAPLNEPQLIEFRRKIGVIHHDSGLVSNLTVWENLTLQLAYHTPLRRGEMEERGRGAITMVGYDGPLSVLPSRLTIYQRRLVAFARGVLAEPELMIYHSPLDGLTHGECSFFLRLMEEYHHRRGDRTALFLTSNPETLKGFRFDFTYSTGAARRTC